MANTPVIYFMKNKYTSVSYGKQSRFSVGKNMPFPVAKDIFFYGSSNGISYPIYLKTYGTSYSK